MGLLYSFEVSESSRVKTKTRREICVREVEMNQRALRDVSRDSSRPVAYPFNDFARGGLGPNIEATEGSHHAENEPISIH